MSRWSRTSVGATLAVVAASLVTVVATQESASALPPVCSSTDPSVITWNGSQNDDDWGNFSNWTPAGIPGAGNGIVCIGISDAVAITDTNTYNVDQLHMAGGATLDVAGGNKLFINGATESTIATDAAVSVEGQMGGTGTLRVLGNLVVNSTPASPSFLTSNITTGGGQPPPADKGDLIVQGHATLTGTRGVGLVGGYQMTVAGGGSVSVGSGTWVAADNGAGMTINPGGTFDIGGNGGFYKGAAVAGQPVPTIVNSGVLQKSSGGGLSVVEGLYSGGGQVVVKSGALGMPDNQKITGTVAPGTVLATARCSAPATTTSCPTSPLDTVGDPDNLSVSIPGANGGNATVQIQELPPVGPAVDPQGIGNEVLAHVDGLTSNTASPARIDIRYSQADVMSTPLDQIQVVHTEDSGQQVLLPACGPGGVPAGLFTCVVRPALRGADFTIVTVLTNVTSRWRLRRGPAIANQGAPSVPQGVKLTKVQGGAALKLSWQPPATSGAGPLSGYQVKVDGKTKAVSGSSYTLKNPGKGKHTLAVAALNAAGTSTFSSTAKVKLTALSAPLKPKGVEGKAGGKTTAGLKWKPPASAGGRTIKTYQVAVFNRGGRLVATKKVKGKLRKLQVGLPAGEYRFRLRAKNRDGNGPWSKYTGFVRSR